MPQDTDIRTNRDIDNLIIEGQFHMAEDWGMQQLADYLQELQLVSIGVPYSELGIAQRRHSARPGIIKMAISGPKVIQDPELLNNAELTPAGSYAHLRLEGVMRSKDGASHQGVGTLINSLQAAYQNDNIQGILLEANTGGGEATAGQMLKAALEQSPKAVVTYAHFLASAGVMGTLPSDEIIASSLMAEIGSIGTYITLSRGFREWYARNFQEVYADKSTNKNKELRQYIADGDLSGIRAMVNRTNEHFLNDVQQYRPLKGNIENTLSGELFDAPKAKRRGLIDGIGSFQHAIKRLGVHVKRRQNQ